jgi:hypothetical protein
MIKIIFYFFLLDALFVNIIAWFFSDWYFSKFQLISKYLPMTKGWALAYIILVFWIGYLSFK